MGRIRPNFIWYGSLTLAALLIPVASYSGMSLNWRGAGLASIVLFGWLVSSFHGRLTEVRLWIGIVAALVLHLAVLWLVLFVVLAPNTRIGNFWWAPMMA